jgi:ElaB/YqjD/DUF883 family membrane-anchored ribosome-binding protein
MSKISYPDVAEPTPRFNGPVGEQVQNAAQAAGEALSATQRAAGEVGRSLQAGIDDLRERVPGALSRVAGQAEELTRHGVDRAREATHIARDRAARAGDQTVAYIRDEPVKAMLVAAAAGALTAVLLGWMNRSRSTRY